MTYNFDKGILDVWAQNLEEEIEKISELINDYPIISIDTEFPGTVVFPDSNSIKDNAEYNFTSMRLNVNFLKIIQIGITLSTEQGAHPSPIYSWQFNFKFEKEEEIYNQESIELLEKYGINFEEHSKSGILPSEFAQVVYTSGLIMNDKLTYISFHSLSDFGYLLKILTSLPIPDNINDFYTKLNILFPNFYDLKLIYYSDKGEDNFGLQTLADIYRVNNNKDRIHQAGSDSYVTFETFLKFSHKYYQDKIKKNEENYLFINLDWKNYKNKLYGIYYK